MTGGGGKPNNEIVDLIISDSGGGLPMMTLLLNNPFTFQLSALILIAKRILLTVGFSRLTAEPPLLPHSATTMVSK